MTAMFHEQTKHMLKETADQMTDDVRHAVKAVVGKADCNVQDKQHEAFHQVKQTGRAAWEKGTAIAQHTAHQVKNEGHDAVSCLNGPTKLNADVKANVDAGADAHFKSGRLASKSSLETGLALEESSRYHGKSSGGLDVGAHFLSTAEVNGIVGHISNYCSNAQDVSLHAVTQVSANAQWLAFSSAHAC